jgi:tripartite-type tricarboxylate transporter receptor subunit TctC
MKAPKAKHKNSSISKRISIGLLPALAIICANQATAQTYPTKPVRMIVATAPGGGDDFATRLVAPKLGELLGQQFVVENRAGAGGMIGQTFVAKAAPDGYTLLLAGGSMAGARYVNASISYDVLRDFSPISLLETAQFILVVHPSIPARNVKEYIALLRSTPGKMTFGTIGPGQIPYWGALLFNNMARIQAVEVAYKGISELTVDLIGGRLDYHFAPSATAAAHKAKLRALASTGTKRMAAFPGLPTMAEAALPGYDMPAWRSIMGPAGMRREVVDTLNKTIVRAVAMPDVQEKMMGVGSEPETSTPDALTRRYVEWSEIFGRIAAQAGIKPM